MLEDPTLPPGELKEPADASTLARFEAPMSIADPDLARLTTLPLPWTTSWPSEHGSHAVR
jgi:hypothetical protein